MPAEHIDPALLLAPDVPVLTEEELEALPEELREEYLAALALEMQQMPLTPPQRRAHDLCMVVDEVLYGGSAGGGKSFLAVWHADYLSRQFDHHRTLILRSSLPELRRTIMVEARRVIDLNEYPGVKWRAADKEYHYGNGSVIEMGFCENMDDVRQYLSAEYDCIIIDESTDMSQEQIEMLRSRLRTTKAKKEKGVNVHLLMLSNPGGVSHAFHRDRYVRNTSDGLFVAELDERDDKGRGRARQVAFVPARVGDNPFIDEDYVSNLAAISDPVKRAQYLDGDWSMFEGQFFDSFDYELHTCEPFTIPDEWPRVGGYDWGFADAACLLIGAVDPDKVLHVFWEMYVEQHTAGEQGRIYGQFIREGKHKVDFIAADPSIWRNTGVGVPISSQLFDAGIMPLRRASNARVDGWSQVREYLAVDPVLGKPRLVIHRTCENLIRTFPEVVRDKNKPEDVKGRGEDHALDALRYLLMTRPRAHRLVAPGPKTYDERVRDYVVNRHKMRRRPIHDVLGRL